MQDLLETTHFLTRVKVAPAAQGFFDGGSGEAKRAAELAAKLSVPSLTRAWQMLLKGLFEVRDATRPISACEMALIRLAYAAELPPTDKLVRDLLDSGARARARAAARPRRRAPRARAGARRAAPCARRSRMPEGAPTARPSATWKTSPRWRANNAPGAEGAYRKRRASGAAGTGPHRIPPLARAPRAPWPAICSRNCGLDRRALEVSIASQGGAPTLAEQKKRPRPRASKAWCRSLWCAPCWTVFPAPKSWRCATYRAPRTIAARHAGTRRMTPDGSHRLRNRAPDPASRQTAGPGPAFGAARGAGAAEKARPACWSRWPTRCAKRPTPS